MSATVDGHHHGAELGFLGHDACVTDAHRPQFEQDWQRRAFGVAVALSEFGHYPWAAFQQRLIAEIARWEASAASSPSEAGGAAAAGSAGERWEYYEHWLAALERIVVDVGLVSAEEADVLHRAPDPGRTS